MRTPSRLLPLLTLLLATTASSAPLVLTNFTRIDYPSSDGLTYGNGINNAGVVVGVAQNDADALVGYAYTPATGLFDTLDLGSGGTSATKINNRGVIAGIYSLQPAVNIYLSQPRGFTDDAGVITSDAVYGIDAINDAGDTAGYVLPVSVYSDSFSAFVQHAGKVTTFGCSRPYNFARDINNADVVVGVSESNGDDVSAFLYRDGQCTDISVPGAIFSEAEGINDEGDVVGDYDDGTSAGAFLLHNGVYYLTTYPDFPPDDFDENVIVEISDINDVGEVVGYAYDFATGVYFAFTATAAIPAPPTNALVAIGAFAWLILKRRQWRTPTTARRAGAHAA